MLRITLEQLFFRTIAQRPGEHPTQHQNIARLQQNFPGNVPIIFRGDGRGHQQGAAQHGSIINHAEVSQSLTDPHHTPVVMKRNGRERVVLLSSPYVASSSQQPQRVQVGLVEHLVCDSKLKKLLRKNTTFIHYLSPDLQILSIAALLVDVLVKSFVF